LSFDIKDIKEDFPILKQRVYDKPLVYLDNAATTQKPSVVIEALRSYYEKQNSNIHRAAHYLGDMATAAYEESRKTIAEFINAEDSSEVIFTKGTTDAINLVASSFGKRFLNEGDEVIVSYMEHHSNIVPWQLICDERGAKLRVIPIDDSGELILEEYEKLLNKNTRIVAISHVSNAIGTINPVREIIRIAHQKDIPVLIDGAQAVPHVRIDVQDIDCDFYAFSSHKVYGPMGVGILFGKKKYLTQMPPYQGGGEMIENVSFEKTTYNELPFKFEAGTPNVADVVGFKKAIEYVEGIGYDNITSYENELVKYLEEELRKIEGIRIYGNPANKASVVSFNVEDIHPYDVGMIIDKMGVAVRTGNHCAQPLMDRFGITGTVRASLAVYNTFQDVDIFINALKKTIIMFNA
jgi:cysteine desulfurase/selenocysteine lyase